MSGIWLNIGCGKQHLSGFVNMDIEQPYDKKLDARKGLPYPDQTVDGVYSEHFFEHLTQAEGLGFLRETRRVLKPGGIVRVAMPDLDAFVQRYVSEDWRGDGDMFKLGFDWVANRCEMLNLGLREWGHKHLYNEEELIRIAQMAGLEPTKRCEHGKSDTPEFIGRETRNGSKLIIEFTVPDRTVGTAPLVSVLIPAYRATWFKQALQSALTQTYQNIEVIISDDSPNEDIQQIVRSETQGDVRVTYIRNDPPLGALGNFLNCFSRAQGEFIKFLNDDDLLAPTCIEKMLHAFREHPSVTLVTSYRKRIDEAGMALPEIALTRAMSKRDCELEGVSCANALIQLMNFIGEPSTVMFRKIDLSWVKPHLATIGGMMATGCGDVAMWLNLLGRGNAYYLAEPLSFFRIHAGQRQNELPMKLAAQKSWVGFFFHGKRLGLMPSRIVWRIKRRYASSDSWGSLQVVTTQGFYAMLQRYFWQANKPYLLVRRYAVQCARRAWHRLPLSTRDKQKIKYHLSSKLPLLFRRFAYNRDWQDFDLLDHHDAPGQNLYVPLLNATLPEHLPVKLIAFYLPQFHPIPENNKWWGEGFTEWTNVKHAQAQFKEHYQPHIPGEMGYYDLLDPNVQHRQVELAKLYGLGGFCFYMYWFGGKLLLEKPIEKWLNDPSLNLPFCLCWANENWTRRWDGLDKEILIGQKYSPEDDLAFIQYVAQYMRDERYIRIDGKPLLLVYRPSLLPSAKATAQRWRTWCQQNGIGDIYLAYTQSFEMVDPGEYEFDAAIEFPPNNTRPPVVTKSVKPLNSNFGCTVFDWRSFVQRSLNFQNPSYKLFRGVCPSWDNTARRKNKSNIFINSSPRGYQEWLANAIVETRSRIKNPEERLIFVNAWNEWAEGAHLEPDQKYGYAYLEATRMALTGEPISR